MSFDPNLCRNESEVESKLIVQYLLPNLGYSPDTWHQEVALGSIRLDFIAFASQVIPFPLNNNYPLALVLEAKSPKEKLKIHERKLKRYLEALKVSYGLLTNGKELKIYRIKSDEFKSVFQCQGRDIESKIADIKKLIGREEIKNQQQSLFVTSLTNLNNIKISQEQRMMRTLAVYHNKGGVGKTTTVVNLAAALSKKGRKVLVIDLDSQANTTFAAGLMKFRDEHEDNIKSSYVYHVIREKNKYPIAEVVRQSSFTSPEFDVIPSHIDLMKQEFELREIGPARFRLIKKLQQVQNNYDIVLIDTPPALNLYSEIALLSTQYLIIPSDLKPFANEGLLNVKDFIEEINEFREGLGKKPIEVLGVLASKVPTSARFVKYTLPKMIDNVKNNYGYNLLESKIFERRDISAAIEKTVEVGDLDIPAPQSILDYKPDSQAADEFEALAEEIIQLIEN